MRISAAVAGAILLFPRVEVVAFHARAKTVRRVPTVFYYKSGDEFSASWGDPSSVPFSKDSLVSDLQQQHDDLEEEQLHAISQSSLMTSDDGNNIVHLIPKEPTTAPSTTPANPLSDVNKARLLLLGAAALYGTNFSLVKILGETGMSVGLSSTLRFGMATLATLPWLFSICDDDNSSVTNGQAEQQNRWQRLFNPQSVEFQAAMGGFEVGMWNSIGYVAQAVGLETTTASKSAFLCSMAVVVVPILDYMQGRTLLNKQVWGVILAMCGVAFLEFEDAANLQAALQLSPGDIASLIQPLAFGLGFWRMEKVMRQHPEEADRSTAAQLLAVFLGSAAYMFATNLSDPSTIPPMDQFVTWITDPAIIMALFWTGVITTALTIYMETLALKTLSAAETTLIFSTEPLWGTAFAGAVMGETFGINAALGAAFILAGCLYSNLGLKGILSVLPCMKNGLPVSGEADATEGLDDEKFLAEQHGHQSMLSKSPLSMLSIKPGVAGGLTGLVASVQMAHSATTFVPDELQDFLEHLSNSC